jgi:serine/threonine protein kinase
MEEPDSVFGVELDRLKRLLTLGKEELDEEAPEHTRQTTSFHGLTERPGMQIGRYKLLRVLGEGGMGNVYLAQQDRPIKRQVALKVIKPGMDSARVIARFEAERQALALLDHINIAQVYDAGTTEAGRPYFVMEYVEGLPITEYCDHHKLMIEQRLNLFSQVCHAVYHAHQKGIIHRDIKPSNILVTTQEDQVVPKMIDFGVAKAVSQPLTERTLFTEHGQLFGTPEYMSPEQADPGSEDIDTRSDVYSLGVLLYVLLTGCLPFDSDTLREGGVEHIRRIILETNPKTPSTRLAGLGDEAGKVAESRGTEVASLTRRLKKELEWIPLKAMRRDRNERYRSPSELADDVENYLKGAPLIAGPPSAMYRLKKTVRRHKALVAGVAAVLIVSLIGTVVSLIFALGQARARAQAQATADFFGEIFTDSDPYHKLGQELTIQSLLETASGKLDEGRFSDEPLIEASTRHTLGKTYLSLSEFQAAKPHLVRALHIYRDELGEDNQKTLRFMLDFAGLLYRQDRHQEAEELARKAVDISRRAFGEEDPLTLDAMIVLGMQLREDGRLNEAYPVLSHVLEKSRRVFGEDTLITAAAMAHVALLHSGKGQYDTAEQMLEKVVEIRRRLLGEEHQTTLATMNCLATAYRRRGRYKKSERLYTETIRLKKKIWSEDNIHTLVSMNGLAGLYTDQDRYVDANELFTKVLEGYLLRYDGKQEHRRIIESMNGLGVLRTKQGLYDDANDLLVRALKSGRQRMYPDHPNTLESMNELAVLRTKQKRYTEAEELFEEALEARTRKFGDDHPDTLETKNDLAVLYTEQSRYDEVEKLLRAAVEGRSLKLGDAHPHTQESIKNLIEVYDARGKADKAAALQARLVTTEDRQK